MANNNQINEIYIVRTLAILGVLLVHSTSQIVVDLDQSSTYYPLYNFINIFFKFGTPTFILLSSFVLFYNYFNRPLDKSLIKRFYKKRLLYILVPYLLFSILYYSILVYYYYGHYTYSERFFDFTQKLLTGSAYTHLYFVFISIQFFILFPLLLWVFKASKKFVTYSILIGFVLQWGFVIINNLYIGYARTGSLSISYMSYYFLGAFLGIHYNTAIDWLKVKKENFMTKKGLFWVLLWIVWIGAGLAHVYLYYWTRTTGLWADSRLYTGLWNVHTITSALVLMQLSYWIYEKWSARIVNAMIHLGVASFGVYLFHPLVLFYYRRMEVSGNPIIYHAWIVGGFLAALFISWIVVGLTLKYVKGSWMIFGAAPKKVPYREVEKRNPYQDQNQSNTLSG
ncbi:acyltransferase [Desertibacillus haloalkaliphilus]|uniref:acyltransferase n=1 Tax=Desertibacillus haloalkaliphilus TaxID=1328930 RepID=UPI001C25E437|nr:acyltransferase [Desertibacillus haloalkaliphilus]MBU8905964.1 acyltransferase [Desertibacillus haloalkaliphilus]